MRNWFTILMLLRRLTEDLCLKMRSWTTDSSPTGIRMKNLKKAKVLSLNQIMTNHNFPKVAITMNHLMHQISHLSHRMNLSLREKRKVKLTSIRPLQVSLHFIERMHQAMLHWCQNLVSHSNFLIYVIFSICQTCYNYAWDDHEWSKRTPCSWFEKIHRRERKENDGKVPSFRK